jgi:hypothetical protein
MSKSLNITFEIVKNDHSKFVTFYNIDAIYPSDSNKAVIISGGKEWFATASYPEVWEKLKKLQDESAT